MEQNLKVRKNDNKVASQTFQAANPVRMKTAEEIETIRREKRTSSSTIAGDKFCRINFYHPALQAFFPGDGKRWTVDKFYPYAKGGPLYIDEPRMTYSVRQSEEKIKAFEAYEKKTGIKTRFLILQNGTEPLNEVEGLSI